MPPSSTITTTLLQTEEVLPKHNEIIVRYQTLQLKQKAEDDLKKSYKTCWGYFETELKFFNIIMLTLYHLYALYILIIWGYLVDIRNIIFAFIVGGIGGFGVTAGAHRLWTHRCYKAKVPLRILLLMCYCVAGQNSPYEWVRDHRVHHKFSETDADPHNSKRGFFFAHVGWLMMKKHPEVLRKGQQVDCSDLMEDPVFAFFQKYFFSLRLIFCFIIPIFIPIHFWNNEPYHTIMVTVVRHVVSLNCTWCVNSAAHLWGNRPYDKRINPVENLSVALVAMGEGWHNYHHAFPWDYKAAELGNYSVNITTMYIDLFAKLGLAYDLKQPSKELVQKVILAHGDGSHPEFGHKEIPESADLEFRESRKLM